MKCRKHPHLLQINTWVWLERLSRQAGRPVQLGDVADEHWDRLQGQGFDLVYLLGVWQRSSAGRRLFRTDAKAFAGFDAALPAWTVENIVGSPFSITAYAPDARIGDWDQIDAVRDRLAARGMGLILDFIPNHVGPDHPWVTDAPDRLICGRLADFKRDPSAFILVEPQDGAPYFVARGRDPYFAPWADTAQIDHFSPAARTAMIESLRSIAAHCDGLRCDMAMLVLNDVFAKTWSHLLDGRPVPATEFWSDAVGALPKDFIWIAEAYWGLEAPLQALGFSYTYDKCLYDDLLAADAGRTRAHLGGDSAAQSRMARFIENHDEPRACAHFGRDRVPGLTAVIATLPGLRFFHDGQFEGRRIHVPMPLDRAADEPADAALQAICARILRLADDPVFHDGTWSPAPVEPAGDGTSGQLIAYHWRLDDAFRLLVLNVNGAAAQGRVMIAGEVASGVSYAFNDLLNDAIYVRDGEELVERGIYVRLDGFAAHVFCVTARAL
jgi:hypothetical protein